MGKPQVRFDEGTDPVRGPPTLQGQKEEVAQASHPGWLLQPKRAEMDRGFRPPEAVFVLILSLVLLESRLRIQGPVARQ